MGDAVGLVVVAVGFGLLLLIDRWRPLTVEKQIWLALLAVIIVLVVSCTYFGTRPDPRYQGDPAPAQPS